MSLGKPCFQGVFQRGVSEGVSEGVSDPRGLRDLPAQGDFDAHPCASYSRGYRLLWFKKTPALTRQRRLRVGGRVPGDVSAKSCAGEVALTSCVGTRERVNAR